MDQISASWEYQEDYNVLNFTNLDDPGQPYSCGAWGNQGSLSDNLMTEDGNGYNLFNDFQRFVSCSVWRPAVKAALANK